MQYGQQRFTYSNKCTIPGSYTMISTHLSAYLKSVSDVDPVLQEEGAASSARTVAQRQQEQHQHATHTAILKRTGTSQILKLIHIQVRYLSIDVVEGPVILTGKRCFGMNASSQLGIPTAITGAKRRYVQKSNKHRQL